MSFRRRAGRTRAGALGGLVLVAAVACGVTVGAPGGAATPAPAAVPAGAALASVRVGGDVLASSALTSAASPVPGQSAEDVATRAAKARVAEAMAARQAKLDAISADPEAKAAYVAKKERDRKKYEARLHAKESSPKAQAARKAAEQWPTGIFDSPEAPIGTATFRGVNRWVGTIAGDTVAVYAGASGQDTSTGRLFIVWQHPKRHADGPGEFVDLPAAGPLRATGADGDVVTLEGTLDGARHRFDMSAGEWLGA